MDNKRYDVFGTPALFGPHYYKLIYVASDYQIRQVGGGHVLRWGGTSDDAVAISNGRIRGIGKQIPKQILEKETEIVANLNLAIEYDESKDRHLREA